MDYSQLADKDLANILEEFKENVFKRLNCIKIGIILSFDLNTQTASILIKGLPKISNIPVSFISGQNFSIQVPIQKGDDCIVLFSDKALDKWKNSGLYDSYLDYHGLNGAIALVGIKNLLTKIDNYATNEIRIKYKDTVLEISDNGIYTNSNLKVDGNIEVEGNIEAKGDIKSTDGDVVAGTISLKNHVHSGVTSGGSSTGKPVGA